MLRSCSRGLLLAALLLALISVPVLWRAAAPAPPQALTIAIPKQMSSGAVFVARDQDYFAGQSMAVTLRSYTLGKQALQAVLDDQADLALVADVPFMLASQRGAPIAVIATVFASRQTMALVGRRDRGIAALADVGGKTVGTVRGTNAEYFLDLMFERRPLAGDPIIADVPPDQIGAALRSGQVDAVTAWNPLLANILHDQGSNAAVMRIPDLFVYRFLLVGKRSYIDGHPDAMRRTLKALSQAVGFIQTRPGQAQALIAAAVGLQPDQLKASWRAEDYAVSLDQSLLLSLEDQTRWAVRKGLIAPGPAPNYLDVLELRPLTAIDPTAVTIIH